MKKLILLSTILSFAIAASAQDTNWVHTFRYSSTTRDTVVQFPEDTSGLTYEKILMLYSMRCKNGLISTSGSGPSDYVPRNKGCGEWDYSCNTYVTDSTQNDSVKATHNSHDISNFSGSTYNYTSNPTYTYYQFTQHNVTVDSVISENIIPLAPGSIPLTHPFSNGTTTGKTQYIWRANELLSSGMVAGNIDGMEFDIASLGSEVKFLRVSLKMISDSQFTEIEDATGMQLVYFSNTTFASTGYYRLQFFAPFNWDGVSNLCAEVSYSYTPNLPAIQATGETTSLNFCAKNLEDDYYLRFDGSNDQVNSGDINAIDSASQFTMEGWVYIDQWVIWSDIFNDNDQTVLQMGDATGRLYAIVRVPGNNTYGYVSSVLPMNTWTHVAMVFDGTASGNANRLKLFVNGVQTTLTFNGTIPAVTQQNSAPFTLGDRNPCRLDEVHVFSVPLNAATILDQMKKRFSNAHPDYANCILAYSMNEGSGPTLTDLSPSGNNGTLMNGTNWFQFRGNEIFKALVPINERPNVRFAQGNYQLTLMDSIVMDSMINLMNTVTTYTVSNNHLIPVDTTDYYQATWSYVYDEAGNKVDSLLNTSQGTINITTLNYFSFWPMKIELMSFVTPYGIGLDLGMNGKMWIFDVSDYATVLKGLRRINMERGGEWQENIDIKFAFVKGVPPRPVLHVQQIWPVTHDGYTQIQNDTRYEPRNITLDGAGNYFRVRSAITGHGQEGEFIPQTHRVNINGGTPEFDWLVLKLCAKNPVYPQGGTWVYDRAGWCPGAPSDIRQFNITPFVTAGASTGFDYNVLGGSGDSRYIVNNQLVQFGAANFSLDARIDEVKNPGTRIEYSRQNPICTNPVIRITNTGSDTIHSLDIHYGLEGNTPQLFHWTGTLATMQTVDDTLPVPSWSGSSSVFLATISNPNGAADMYAQNDTLRSPYVSPTILPPGIIIQFKTNSEAGADWYSVKDATGATMHYRMGALTNHLYRDSLWLQNGCYSITLSDYDQDGLTWWANSGQGAGYFRIQVYGGSVVKTFNSDFGAEIYFQFHVDSSTGIPQQVFTDKTLFNVFPNPSEGMVYVNAEFAKPTNGSVKVIDISGKTVREIELKNTTEEGFDFDLTDLPKGFYTVVLTTDQETLTRRLILE